MVRIYPIRRKTWNSQSIPFFRTGLRTSDILWINCLPAANVFLLYTCTCKYLQKFFIKNFKLFCCLLRSQCQVYHIMSTKMVPILCSRPSFDQAIPILLYWPFHLIHLQLAGKVNLLFVVRYKCSRDCTQNHPRNFMDIRVHTILC